MSKWQSDFIKDLIKMLRKEGFKDDALNRILTMAWCHGAATALYAPEIAVADLSPVSRAYFARLVYNLSIEINSGDLTTKKRRELIRSLLELEPIRPLTTTNGSSGWLIGKRSSN